MAFDGSLGQENKNHTQFSPLLSLQERSAEKNAGGTAAPFEKGRAIKSVKPLEKGTSALSLACNRQSCPENTFRTALFIQIAYLAVDFYGFVSQ